MLYTNNGFSMWSYNPNHSHPQAQNTVENTPVLTTFFDLIKALERWGSKSIASYFQASAVESLLNLFRNFKGWEDKSFIDYDLLRYIGILLDTLAKNFPHNYSLCTHGLTTLNKFLITLESKRSDFTKIHQSRISALFYSIHNLTADLEADENNAGEDPGASFKAAFSNIRPNPRVPFESYLVSLTDESLASDLYKLNFSFLMNSPISTPTYSPSEKPSSPANSSRMNPDLSPLANTTSTASLTNDRKYDFSGSESIFRVNKRQNDQSVGYQLIEYRPNNN